MQGQLRQGILVTFSVFVVAVIVSLAASGAVSDIAFVVYVLALVVLIGLLVAWFVGRGRRGPTAGQP